MTRRIISLLTILVMLMSICITPVALAANPTLDLTLQNVSVSGIVSPETWVLLVASYDGYGDIVQSHTETVDHTFTTKSLTTDLGFVTDGTNGAIKIKAFLWKDLVDIQAAGECKEVAIQPDMSGAPSRPSNTGGTTTTYKLSLFVDGAKHTVKSYSAGTVVDLTELAPEKDGYKLEGFYSDEDLTTKVNSSYKVTKNTNIYVKYVETQVGPTPSDETPFNTTDHFAYISGDASTDGSFNVRPDDYITREEVTTIFYRLLKEEVKDKYYTTTNNFKDVDKNRWSNEYVSTIANGGFIKGDPDGSFRPEDNITRAEFVTIATRFFDADGDATSKNDNLKDIKGHWGINFINYSVNAGWIKGYEDNTFRPDANISRAEVMTIINRILDRKVDEAGLVEGFVSPDDNAEGAWYYYEVLEATNAHTFNRVDEVLEKWLEIK